MKSFGRAVVCGTFLALVMVGANESEARHPTYVLLRGPASPVPHHPTYGYYPGYAVQVETRTYTYGWFGAKPRRHWSHHSGYYGNFREWSAR